MLRRRDRVSYWGGARGVVVEFVVSVELHFFFFFFFFFLKYMV